MKAKKKLLELELEKLCDFFHVQARNQLLVDLIYEC